MNLAIVSPTQSPTPPIGYGGTERIVDVLVRSLMDLGHTVDLYAGPGTTCPATNLFIAKSQNLLNGETELLQHLYKFSLKYDCIIDAGPFHLASQNIKGPTIALMRGDTYITYPHSRIRNKVYPSKEYAKNASNCNYPHVLDPVRYNQESIFQLGSGSGNYALVYSVVNPQKGVHLAIKAAEIGGFPIKIAGPLQDIKYWNRFCNFSHVHYVGEIHSESVRIKLLQNASVLLFTSILGEGCPVGVKEALLCGTPVVASEVNGTPTLIEPRINGLFARYEDELASAYWIAKTFDRNLVRNTALEKLDTRLYAERIIELCTQANKGAIW